jgi:hypothetical protein
MLSESLELRIVFPVAYATKDWATLALTILPALVPKVTPFALLNPRVENRKEPLDALAATG